MLEATYRKLSLRWLASVAGAVVVALAGFVWSDRPIPIKTVVAEKDVPVRVFGLGTIEARMIAKLGFEVGAAIIELNADHGESVKFADIAVDHPPDHFSVLQTLAIGPKADIDAGPLSVAIAILRRWYGADRQDPPVQD